MPSERPRRKLARKTQLECLEDRMVMSAESLGGLLGGSIQHHAWQDDYAAPAIEQHQVLSHVEQGPDFWIDPADGYDLEQHVYQIEQALSSAHGQTGLAQVQNSYGFFGAGQTVAVIDSGIAYTHYALGGGFGSGYRVVGGYDFTESGAAALDPYDDGPHGGHGTHVAGIVGANAGNNSGVAPQVDLVGLRVFDDAGAGYFSWVEQALRWVHTNRDAFENPITAVNLSLGTDWNSSTIPNWAMLEDEFAQLEADGIFISVSAGNSFQTFNAPGLSYPAASSYVVPVMATDDNGSLSYFSQRHSRAIAAPGRSITSTVPDYVGNDADTIDNDFATWSGTSMAAPYVAGASVLIREAMQFVGYTDITQDTIYDHIVSTSVQFYDSATSAWYNRLNLSAAIDALMPADDYGSTVATAHALGQIGSVSEISGLVGMLSDQDYFTFTADFTGTVELSATATHNLQVVWSGTGSVAGTHGEVFTIDVVSGQSYTFGVSTSNGIGYYNLAVDAQSAFTYTDWGMVYFNQQNNIVGTGDQWYRVVAGQSGILTLQASFAQSAGNVNLDLYNADMLALAGSHGNGNSERIDWQATAGEEFYLCVTGVNDDIDFQLTNLVSQVGNVVHVNGTSGDDTFAFTAGASHGISINGVVYSFNAQDVNTISFDGGAGSDVATLTGGSGTETATLRVGNATLSGPGYSVGVTNVETVTVDAGSGGSNEMAYFYDSAGDDIFTARPDSADLRGNGFIHTASGFDRVYAYATAGGNDSAHLHDSTGNDIFSATPQDAVLYGVGFYSHAGGFDRVHAYASAGDDRAFLYDSAGNDMFVASPDYAVLYGSGFNNRAVGFDRAYAFASSGDDRAYFYDSPEDDTFTGRPDWARMFNASYYNQATGFDRAYAYSTSGADTAYLYDSEGNDTFAGRHDWAHLYGNNFYNHVSGFSRVHAYASGGDDQAYLYDSDGNDTFKGTSTFASLSGVGYFNIVVAFERVNAYASSGNDIAYIYDTSGDDVFRGMSTHATIQSAAHFQFAGGFDRVYAYASLGTDYAYLYDSAGNDTFVSVAEYAILHGSGFYNYAKGFDGVYAYATGGGDDVAYMYDSPGDDIFGSSPTQAIMKGSSFFNSAHWFDRVYSYSTAGNDLAVFYDSVGDDTFTGRANWSSMAGSGYYNYAAGFSRVTAIATSGYDVASIYDGAGDDRFEARKSYYSLLGSNYKVEGVGFDAVDVYGTSGGNNELEVELILDYIFNAFGDWF